jgi:hypothetical protein
MTDAQLGDLLEAAHLDNADHGITGTPAHRDGNSIQYAEGPAGEFDQRMRNLERDPRHTGIIIQQQDNVAARAFPIGPRRSTVRAKGRHVSPGALSSSPADFSRPIPSIFRAQRECSICFASSSADHVPEITLAQFLQPAAQNLPGSGALVAMGRYQFGLRQRRRNWSGGSHE